MKSDVREAAAKHLDKRAASNWERARNAYLHYDNYIKRKPDRLALSIVDLLHVTNFKGGSATISEHPDSLNAKLENYERALREADAAPEFRRSLRDLSDDECARAKDRIIRFAALGSTGNAGISGFGVSFASALLHFYFPELVPILDKRALNGARVDNMKCDTQNQVKNIIEHYPALIDFFRDQLRLDATLTLRELDRLLFVQELRRPPFLPKRSDR